MFATFATNHVSTRARSDALGPKRSCDNCRKLKIKVYVVAELSHVWSADGVISAPIRAPERDVHPNLKQPVTSVDKLVLLAHTTSNLSSVDVLGRCKHYRVNILPR